MTGNQYQKLAARTINQNLTKGEQSMHALFGMASEVGELHGIYQKHYQGHTMNHEHMKKECGDILWMVAEFCTAAKLNQQSRNAEILPMAERRARCMGVVK